MTYTEIKEVKGKKYYYRVKSIRKGKRVEKERKYLGVNLTKNELSGAERLADKELIFLNNISAVKSNNIPVITPKIISLAKSMLLELPWLVIYK